MLSNTMVILGKFICTTVLVFSSFNRIINEMKKVQKLELSSHSKLIVKLSLLWCFLTIALCAISEHTNIFILGIYNFKEACVMTH